MNKKGKKMSGGMTALFVIVGIVAILGILNFAGVLNFKQGAVGTNGAPVVTGGGNTIISASTPAVAYDATDAILSGTAVTGSQTVFVNGNYVATAPTQASLGDKFEVLYTNGTSYHNAYTQATINGAVNRITSKLYKNASMTIAVYNTGKSAMTNSVSGAVNQTVSTGSAPTMEIDFTGTSQASTSDLVCILEGSNTAKINKLELNGFGATFVGTAKPSSYTLGATTSGVWVYEVPALKDASLRTGSIYAESKSGQDMSGTYFKVSCYSKEYFLDSQTGKISYAIEDSLGTLKSIASYTFSGGFE